MQNDHALPVLDAEMYAALPYALAQGDVEVPYLVIQTIIWSLITYFMMGFVLDAGAMPLLYSI